MRFTSCAKALLPLIRSAPAALALLGVFCDAREIGASPWRTTEGAALEGELLGIERGALAIQAGAGKPIVRIPMEHLDAPSLEAAENWAKDRSPADRLPPAVWQDRTPTVSESIEEESASGSWIFRTRRYEFRSDAPLTAAAIGEVSRIAETTVARATSLPIRLPPPLAEGRYVARLFRDRADYEKAGGSSTSAGQYVSGWRRPGYLIVPFDSLGIREFAGGHSKSAEFDSHVLIHEIGHQVMARYLPFMPQWLSEGMAEYIALPPYRAAGFASSPRDLLGAVRARQDYYRGLRRAFEDASGPFKERVEFTPIPLRQLLDPSEVASILSSDDLRKIHQTYFTAMLLTFYLLHFEGDGEGRRLRAYFETLGDTGEYMRSRGARGRLPDGVVFDESLSLESLRATLNQTLPGIDEADALQKAIADAFARSNIRLEFR